MFTRRFVNPRLALNYLAALGVELAIVGVMPSCTATTSTSDNTGGQGNHTSNGGTASSHPSGGSGNGGTAHGSGGGSSGGMSSSGGTNSPAGTGGTPPAEGGANNDGGMGGDNTGPSDADAAVPLQGSGGSSSVVDAGACVGTEATHPSEGALHVTACSPVSYGTNPPSSGNHYPIWGAFGVYQFPLPAGYWVHNLEHGAVVVLYNCPQGCAAELATLTNWFTSLPVDQFCSDRCATQPRALLLPDPDLDVRFAATAWQNTLKADCFDEAVFTAFYQAHVGNGLEPVCTSGQDFRGPDGMPTAALAADCGK